MPLPDLHSLRCFDAAATHLNFSVAAKTVALSPAAFSTRISALEDLLGVRLFERSTRRVSLTLEGARLLPQARRTLEEAARCRSVARGDGTPTPFELVLGTRWELGLSWLVPALDGLGIARPERTIHLQFGDSPDLLGRVHRGQVDAMVSSIRLGSPGLEYAALHSEDYVFVASPALVAQSPLTSAVDAPAHTLLDAHPDLPLFRYFLDAQPHAATWTFARTEILGAIAAIRHRAAEGAGAAVLPRYFVQADLDCARLIALCPDHPILSDAFRLVWRTGHPRDAELRLLASELRALPLR
ncbi:MAG: LysR family transcriptional regulator [Myxococcales bacterium]|nr:LysR family transcriptional regulator [Myxococcales bacterium]